MHIAQFQGLQGGKPENLQLHTLVHWIVAFVPGGFLWCLKTKLNEIAHVFWAYFWGMPACIEQGSGSVLNASDMAYIWATSSANCPPEIHLKSLFSQGSCTLIQGEEFQYTQKYNIEPWVKHPFVYRKSKPEHRFGRACFSHKKIPLLLRLGFLSFDSLDFQEIRHLGCSSSTKTVGSEHKTNSRSSKKMSCHLGGHWHPKLLYLFFNPGIVIYSMIHQVRLS